MIHADGFQDRSANAVCTFAYCSGPEADVHIFEGITEGTIVDARGPLDFGWQVLD